VFLISHLIPNDYIEVQDSTTNTFGFPNKTGCISAWVKIDDLSVERPIASKRETGSPGKRQWIFNIQTDGKVKFYAYNTDNLSDVATSNSTLSTNQWYHITVNITPSITKIYINGVLDAIQNNTYSTIQDDQANLRIARRGANADIRYFDGEISNVQFWNTDLTDGGVSQGSVATGQIAELYNNGQPLMTGTQPQAANLKGWYKLNQTDSYWDIGETGKWTFNNAAIN